MSNGVKMHASGQARPTRRSNRRGLTVHGEQTNHRKDGLCPTSRELSHITTKATGTQPEPDTSWKDAAQNLTAGRATLELLLSATECTGGDDASSAPSEPSSTDAGSTGLGTAADVLLAKYQIAPPAIVEDLI